MQLDPIVKAFLDQVAAQPGPKMWETDAPTGRAMLVAMMNFVGPQNVTCGEVTNVPAPGRAGDIPLRVYTPAGAGAEVLPALVFFHGGGFVIGDLDTHDGLCRLLANASGARVIAVDYRLAPEHKFPAAVEDAYDAVAWIAENAEEFGIDAERIAVGGDSAGGNLTAVVTQLAKEKGAPRLAFQMLLFPATQMGADTPSMRACEDGSFLDRPTMNWFLRNYLGNDSEKDDLRASPLLAPDLRGLPPAFLMTGGYDPLHDEGVQYAERLREARVPVAHVDYPSLPHDFIYLHAILPEADEAIRQAAHALRDALRKE
jgi:acetyl esterase